AAGDRADREAAADDLAERSDIRIDAIAPLRAVIAKAEGDHLVEDEQCADLFRDATEHLEEFWGRRNQAGAVRHHVDQDTGEVVALGAQYLFAKLDIVERDDDDVIQNALRGASGR